MTNSQRFDLLVEAANLTLHILPFKLEQRILDIFKTLYGEEKLNELNTPDNYNKHVTFGSWDSYIETEIQTQKLSIKETKQIIDRLNNSPRKNWMLIHLIERAIAEGDLNFAESIIPDLPSIDTTTGPYQFMAYRKFLRHYAETSNLEKFKECLKLSKPARGGLKDDKVLLLENYSKRNGFEKGLELCKNKIFGENFCMTTIKCVAHQYSFKEIDKILVTYPIYLAVEPNAIAILYVFHFSNNTKVDTIPADEFKMTLNQVSLIDKQIRWGDGRLVDALFCDLASSSRDIQQINECKKLIIDPFYKRELKYHLENIKAE